MAQHYNPRIVTDGLVMCLDPSQNKSYPTDLPVKDGLIMWMDAADDTTFSYSSGTTVSQWRDKSGFNYHMTPLAGSPTRNAFLNSRKVLAFTTGQDIQNLSIDLRTSPYTVFIISRYTSPSSGTGRILTSNGGYNNWLLGHWASETNKYYANGWVYSTYVALDTNWKMYLGDWGGPSNDLANFYGAGTAIATNSADASAGPWTLGINANSGERSNCEAAEIIVFNRLLSTVERRLVHTYLGQKWGISNTDRSIIDLSGNNNNGLLGDGVTADMPLFDVYNKGALKLDGSTDYVAVANATSLNPATVTVSIWVKRNGYQSSVASYLRRNYNDSYSIVGDIAADNVRFRIHNGSTYPESPNATLSLNEWTNIVGTYDLANIKIYKNGVFVNQTAHTSAISYSSTNTVLTIGRDDPVAGRYMNANYGSVLIYNRALTATEIRQNYEAQKSKFANTIVQQGLVLNLDAGNPTSYAGAGTTWYDVSGNSYNGTLTGGPVYSTDGGGAFLFSGNYSLSPVSTVNSLNGNNLTVEAWVKHNTFGGAGTGRSYISNWHSFNVSNQRGFILRTFDVQTYPTFWWCWGGANYFSAGPSSYVMQTGKIYHIVATYEKNVAMKIYINGNLEYTTSDYTSNTILFDTSNGLYVGFSNINSSYMDGNIYSARLYNRTLTAAEVLQNYNAAKGRFGL